MIGWLLRIFTGKTFLTKPEQITPYVIEHFDEATEQEIVQAAHQVAKVCPRSAERHLLYALRVSKCVPTLKSFKTLGSRWRAATEGPRRVGGLFRGGDSPNYEMAYRFLAELYLRRFRELAREVVDKAEQKAAKCKTPSPKRNAFLAAIQKLEEAHDELGDLPGIREQAEVRIADLERKASEFDDQPVQQRPGSKT